MFSLEQHNSRVRPYRHTYGRYPSYPLVSPDTYEMEDEGLGDLGFSFKKAVKSVTRSAKKVTHATVAPVAIVTNKLVRPVIKAAKKIPVVGGVVKIADKVTGKVVGAGGKIISKVPIIGKPVTKAVTSFIPDSVMERSRFHKTPSSPSKPIQQRIVKTPSSGGGTQAPVPPNLWPVDRPQQPPSTTLLPTPMDDTQPYFQNPSGGGRFYLDEEGRNIAHDPYETPGESTLIPGVADNNTMLVGELVLGGLVLLTLLRK